MARSRLRSIFETSDASVASAFDICASFALIPNRPSAGAEVALATFEASLEDDFVFEVDEVEVAPTAAAVLPAGGGWALDEGWGLENGVGAFVDNGGYDDDEEELGFGVSGAELEAPNRVGGFVDIGG